MTSRRLRNEQFQLRNILENLAALTLAHSTTHNRTRQLPAAPRPSHCNGKTSVSLVTQSHYARSKDTASVSSKKIPWNCCLLKPHCHTHEVSKKMLSSHEGCPNRHTPRGMQEKNKHQASLTAQDKLQVFLRWLQDVCCFILNHLESKLDSVGNGPSSVLSIDFGTHFWYPKLTKFFIASTATWTSQHSRQHLQICMLSQGSSPQPSPLVDCPRFGDNP